MIGRAIVAVIGGVVTATVVILAIETLGRFVVPVPDAPRLEDTAAMRDYLARLPAGAYAFVLLAYAAGVYAGGRVARRTMGTPRSRTVWVVGALLLGATVANLTIITHPLWVVIATVAIVVAATSLAASGPRATVDA